MYFAVQLLAFCAGLIRWVEVPSDKMSLANSLGSPIARRQRWLDEIFYFGQNDFQRKPFPSVSAGDIIFLEPDQPWLVLDVGFLQLSGLTYKQYVEAGLEGREKIRFRWERDLSEGKPGLHGTRVREMLEFRK